MHQIIAMPSRQRGAALSVGLVLLVVLTLLAVSGMNTASTELVMAGNEQYRQNAFHAAETGIENALADLATVPQSGAAVTIAPTPVPGSTSDEYSTSSRYVGDDMSIPGFSAGKFVGIHYEVRSSGTSARNANGQHTQGAYVIQATGGAPTFTSIN
jgi:type IV pilus assembly protein PilX